MIEMTNIVFINGSQPSVVDFINRGLIGCNSKVRISADMSGEEIADRLNNYGCPITMYSFLPLPVVPTGGIFKDAPLDLWKVKKETSEYLCLSFQVIDAFDYPVSFLKYINGMAGVTIYAYGFDSQLHPSWYQYNGCKDEVVWKTVQTDNPNTVDDEAEYKVLEGYVQDFLKELDESLLANTRKYSFEGTLRRARKGDALSQNLLGLWLLDSDLPEGVEVDENPFDLIRKSAKQGFAAAQYNMGVILETGLGGRVADAEELKQAFEWYRKAANQGCAEAMTSVGWCYYKGIGIEPNLSDALSWLKEAATKGDLRGQLLLAEIYAKDERCNNKDQALYWFCQLAQHESLRTPEMIGYAL